MDTRLQDTQEHLGARMSDECKLTQQHDARGNNNEEDFVSEYSPSQENGQTGVRSCESGPHHRCSSSGSSPSSESAFSSASSECDDESGSSLTPVSGRSSSAATSKTSDSSGDLADAPAQLNTVANVAPATRVVRELVDQIRKRFLEKASENEAANEEYEELDLEELRRDLPENINEQEQALAFRFITRFINFNGDLSKFKGENRQQAVDEVSEKLNEFLKFRKHYELTHVLLDQFCKEIYYLHGIFPFGVDKNQLPILYMRARVHRRWSHKLDEAFRRYVAWQVDLMTKSNSRATSVSKTVGRNGIEKDGSFGIVFDCLHVSYSCVDMDFLSYLVKILVTYYPTYCRYALCVDLPWLFRSVWKLVKSWLPEDARNTVHLITAKQMLEFIDADQIPNCVKINDLSASEKLEKGKHKRPESFESVQGIDQLADTLKLSSTEVKQFKSHVDKVLKEYKQSGAV